MSSRADAFACGPSSSGNARPPVPGLSVPAAIDCSDAWASGIRGSIAELNRLRPRTVDRAWPGCAWRHRKHLLLHGADSVSPPYRCRSSDLPQFLWGASPHRGRRSSNAPKSPVLRYRRLYNTEVETTTWRRELPVDLEDSDKRDRNPQGKRSVPVLAEPINSRAHEEPPRKAG